MESVAGDCRRNAGRSSGWSEDDLRTIDRALEPRPTRLSADLTIDREHPLGLIMHGASEENGVIQVAQIWESEEYARRFDEDTLMPALKARGAPLEAESRSSSCEHLVTP